MEISAAQSIAEILKENGVRHVFGNPGTTEAPFMDILSDNPEIEYILCPHEGVAIGMADGYARASNGPSLTNIHTTPGTANSTSFLFNAKKEATPVIVTACDVSTELELTEPFLWTKSLTQLVEQFTKWTWRVVRPEQVALALRRAFKIATAPPTGPVYLAFPQDVLLGRVQFEKSGKAWGTQRLAPDSILVERATELLLKAEFPIAVVGNEVARSHANNELVEFTELLGVPVLSENVMWSTTITAVNYPNDSELYLGTFDERSEIVRASDLVITIGVRMFPAIGMPKRLIQLGMDPWEIGKNNPVMIGIIADPKIALKEMTSSCRAKSGRDETYRFKERRKRIALMREELNQEREALAKVGWDSKPIKPWRLFSEMKKVLPPDTIIVDETVSYSSYLTTYYDFRGAGTLWAGGHLGGAIGWGPAAALGVKLACGERPVVCTVGDGSFIFGLQALWTASRYNIAVPIIITNNRGYGGPKASLFNLRGSDRAKDFIGYDLAPPDIDFARLAESFKLPGRRVEDPAEIRPAIKEALQAGTAMVIDFVMDPSEVGYRSPRLPSRNPK